MGRDAYRRRPVSGQPAGRLPLPDVAGLRPRQQMAIDRVQCAWHVGTAVCWATCGTGARCSGCGCARLTARSPPASPPLARRCEVFWLVGATAALVAALLLATVR